MRTGAVLLVLLSLVFAGCSAPKERESPDPEISDGRDRDPTPPAQPPSSPPSPPVSPPEPDNGAPVARLSASAESGDLPLAVDFTIDASDPEGEDLDWSFDADGDGIAEAEGDEAALPATVSFTYTQAGAYEAVLNVSDGELSAQAVLELAVSAVLPEALMLAGTVAAPCENCSRNIEGLVALGPLLCLSFVTGEAGVDCIWFEVTPEMREKGFTAVSTGGNPDMVFTNTCSFPAGTEEDEPEPYVMPEPDAFHWADGPESGIVPADADCVVLWERESPGDQTITLFVG